MTARPTSPPSALTAAAGRAWSEQLNLLLESTGEGIYGIDLDGRCTTRTPTGAITPKPNARS